MDVAGVPMIKTTAGSDWDSASFSSSGQSPLNGQHCVPLTSAVLFSFLSLLLGRIAVAQAILLIIAHFFP